MTALGTRTVDELGRIALPVSLRQTKHWTTGSKVTFYDFHGVIVIETCTLDQESEQIPEQAPDLEEIALSIN